MTINPQCRFCGTQLTIEMPTPKMFPKLDEKIVHNIANLTGKLAGKCCCNRCADYHRGLDDRAMVVQKLATGLARADTDVVAGIREAISKLLKITMTRTEEHYLISGLVSEHNTFLSMVLDQPEYAAHFVRTFDKKARELAIETHRKNKPKEEQDYAY